MKKRSEMNEYEKAYDFVNNVTGSTDIDIIQPLKKLVDKETPMKLKSNGENCGNCDGLVYRKYEKQCEYYCDNCGQKIDWTDVIKMEEEERQ